MLPGGRARMWAGVPPVRARCQLSSRIRQLASPQSLAIASNSSAFTAGYKDQREVSFPIAHHDGNYFADDATLDRLEGDGRVAFRYLGNPNGSARDSAGVLSENGRVLGLMPHPERAMAGQEGGNDGVKLFESLMAAA